MSLWGLAWLTCMQNVGALRCLECVHKMPSRDVVSWNAILGGCAMHGQGKEALKHFDQICEEGVQPDNITFVCLLQTYSHAGLVWWMKACTVMLQWSQTI